MKWPLQIASHLAAVTAGWILWTSLAHPGNRREASADSAKSRESSLQERRSERAKRNLTGDQLLSEMSNGSTMEFTRFYSREDAAAQKARFDLLNRQADELPPAADKPAAAMALLNEYIAMAGEGTMVSGEKQQELRLRLLHWMRDDPRGMIAALGSSEDPLTQTYSRYFLHTLADAAMSRAGAEEAAKWMGVSRDFDRTFQYQFARKVGNEGDVDQLNRLRPLIDGGKWADQRNMILRAWPLDKADGILRLAADEQNPGVIGYYAGNMGQEGAAWLQKLLASDRLDQAAKDMITSRPDYLSLISRSPNIDLETRTQVISKFNPEKSIDQIKMDIGQNDVTLALREGRDWRYAFRSGAVTADEVFTAVSGKLPDLASKSPEAIKNQLYKELAEDNGPAAMKLLDDVPEDRKWETVMKAPRFMYNDCNPQEFYDFLQKIPAEASEEVWSMRLSAWNDRSVNNYHRLGADFTQWVESLPAGIDREMASYNLLKYTGNSDPALTARLRAEIKDPRLLQRMGK